MTNHGRALLGAVLAQFLWFGCGVRAAEAGAGKDAGHVVVLEDFEVPKPWFTWAGDSDPRPTGGMKPVTDNPHRGKQCGSFFFDTSCGNGYVSTDLARVFPPHLTALRFWARCQGKVALAIRLIDSSGQTHQQSVPQVPGDWRQVVVDLTKATDHHYGGKNDGHVHQPFTKLQILRVHGCEPEAGTVYLDDLEVVTMATADELTEWYWQAPGIEMHTRAPGNLFYPSDTVAMHLRVSPPPHAIALSAEASLFNAMDEPLGKAGPVDLTGANTYAADLALPAGPGYYRVRVRLTDGTHSTEHESRYAVIPDNTVEGKDTDSPFGVNTHFNQGWGTDVGVIVKRAGIAWIRDGEAGPDDRALPVALANGLCYMPCFTAWRAPLAQRFKDALANDPDAERRWDFSDVVEWHRHYAEAYGEHIDAYDLMNEPHGPWSAVLGGGWQGGAWLETFADFAIQVTDAIHHADPGSKVVWEDIDQLLWCRHFATLERANAIDVISPHTYNLHRGRPYPEQQPTLAQMRDFTALMRERGLSWDVWSGEVGFSSFHREDEKAPGFYEAMTETEQADRLVRMMVLHLAHGIRRIFWYDFMNDGWEPANPEHNFGLIRNDRLPKPAVVAYANLIHRLRHRPRIVPYAIGGGGYAYACFRAGPDADPLLIAWLMTGIGREAIPVSSGERVVTCTTIYGRGRVMRAEDRRLVLDLSSSPVIVEGLTLEDVDPYLTPGPGDVGP